MRAHSYAVLTFCVAAGALLKADTVWTKRATGTEELCRRDVIVTSQDGAASYSASSTYYRVIVRQLQGSVVVTRVCVANKDKGESLRVEKSSPDERRGILVGWMKAGYTADITDVSGAKFTVSNLALDFLAPPNVTVIGLSASAFTSVRVKRGERENPIQFADIDTIQVQDGTIDVRLNAGGELIGTLVGPTTASGLALVPALRGIEDLGTPAIVDFEMPLSKMKTIAFKH
ncbi:MAG: hypothetical protein WCB12_00405 [Bryobacteraceae bacterium]